MMADISRIISAAKEAEDATNYAEALRCEVSQNSGDDYTLVWTVAYEGNYPPKK